MEYLAKTAEDFVNTVILEKLKSKILLDVDIVLPEQLDVTAVPPEPESKNEFIHPFMVVGSVQNSLMMGNVTDKNLKVNISGGGDVSCYPHLMEVAGALNQFNLPMHLGYTSGKGIENSKMAEELVSLGVDEVTFTVFSTEQKMREEWVGDTTKGESLKALKIFCETTEVHAASVIVPGVNDGKNYSKLAAHSKIGVQRHLY